MLGDPSLSMVHVTVPNKVVGQQIASALVEGRLAACVNIIPGMCHPWLFTVLVAMLPHMIGPAACLELAPGAHRTSQSDSTPRLLPGTLTPTPLSSLLPASQAQASNLCTCGRARWSRTRSICW